MNYDEAADWLRSLGRFRRRVGLGRMETLLEALGSPHLRLGRVVHIAGTNGKGSTAAMLDAVLTRAGHFTGRFTSPHLQSYCERFVFGGRPATRREFGEGIAAVGDAARRVRRQWGEYPLQFEILTAAAYVMAARAGVDWFIQETGLGGSYDATNIISNPRLTIITNVDLDHTDRLGTDPAAIAADKAGILKPGVPVITAARGPALRIIAARARELNAPLHVLSRAGAGGGPLEEGEGGAPGRGWFRRWTYSIAGTGVRGTEFKLVPPADRRGAGAGAGENGATFGGALHPADGTGDGAHMFATPLPGRHQGENGGLAAAAALIAGVPPQAVAEGLAAVEWPGRIEMVAGDPPIVLDGAHNPAAMAALRRSIEMMFPGSRPTFICGMQKGKDAAGAAEAWHGAPLAGVFTVDLPGGGGIPPEELAAAFRQQGFDARPLPGIPADGDEESAAGGAAPGGGADPQVRFDPILVPGAAPGRGAGGGPYPAGEIAAAAAGLLSAGPVIIAGSFYLIGALRPWLKKSRSGSVCRQKQ